MYPEYTAPGTLDMENVEDGVIIPGSWRRVEPMLGLQGVPRKTGTDAKAIREQFLNYFNNEGSVPWQNERAHVNIEWYICTLLVDT